MDIGMGLLVPTSTVAGTIMNVVNKGLAVAGLTIAREDARVLAEMRAESLDYHELVEFGTPAIATIAEAVASSPCLSQDSVVQTLADLQGSFYALRDELPAEVPDDEIAEALRGCLDATGDSAEVAEAPADEIMAFSAEFVRARVTENETGYRIVDDEGRAYVFDPADWDYDEQAKGWDGERWSDADVD